MYVPLHVHTEYSFLDGLVRIPDYINRAVDFGLEACAITDHGNMSGVVKFYKDCRKAQIKPLIGCEMYIVDDVNVRERKDIRHVVLLAKNYEGYVNLLKLNYISYQHHYYKPRIDFNILSQYKQGLICMSACMAGHIPYAILQGEHDKAREYARRLLEMFGDDFYIEIQQNGLEEQLMLNSLLISLAKELGVPVVATNDVHYLSKDDALAHLALLANQTKKTLKEIREAEDFKGFVESQEFYLKSPEEFKADYEFIPEAVQNTRIVADKCNLVIQQLEETKYLFPAVDLKGYSTPEEYLEQAVKKAFIKKIDLANYAEYYKRLQYELDVIKRLGFASYFLVLKDLVDFCKQKNIRIGWGRGCFLPGSKVLMGNGMVKNIEDIVPGDEVITYKGNVKRVYATSHYYTREKMYSIRVNGDEPICCTADHKFYVLQTGRCNHPSSKQVYCTSKCKQYAKCRYAIKQELKWIEARDIKVGDYLCYPKTRLPDKVIDVIDLAQYDSTACFDDKYVWYERGTNRLQTKRVNRFIPVNRNFAMFAGYFIGNGWSRSSEAQIGLGFHKKDTDKINKVIKLIEDIFGITPTILPHKTRQSVQIIVFSKIVALLCEHLFGKGAINKHIPDILMVSDKEIIHGLLDGLMHTDGCLATAPSENKVCYDTTSYVLAKQIQLLFSQLGIYASIKKHHRKVQNWNTSYKVTVSGAQIFKIKELFPEVHIHPQKYFFNHFIEDDHAFYVRVRNIETFDYEGLVYDLSVEDEASYNINGFAVHNSAAGSLVSYLLGITKVDPIKHNLLFERFLNPERVSLPDVDTDIEESRRDEVIAYLYEKYGKNYVCHIGTHNTLKLKAVLKDVARVLEIDFDTINSITKNIPQEAETIDEISGQIEQMATVIGQEKTKQLIEIARKLQGLKRHPGIHAAGMVLSPVPLDEIVPLRIEGGEVVTQWDMEDIEQVGLIKFDVLGLRTLSVVEECIKLCGIDPDKIPFDDEKTWRLIRAGETVGCFQFESPGIRKLLKDMQASTFEDLIAANAMWRPGPLDAKDETGKTMVEHYIDRKLGFEPVEYDHPLLEPILKDTYAVILYQEQAMQIARDLAGYTMSEADELRKGIGEFLAA